MHQISPQFLPPSVVSSSGALLQYGSGTVIHCPKHDSGSPALWLPRIAAATSMALKKRGDVILTSSHVKLPSGRHESTGLALEPARAPSPANAGLPPSGNPALFRSSSLEQELPLELL
ncbi:parathymosin-like [Pyrus ussuriensis x Pyrus communis]|uniref:Parathymosin-like n=1 Tax=Pyrus ussuriensis x Pyrus communis TaxID=2448454 RepID=A0A5N5F6G1_9ROSA|nr:parathymosin-like [Pyrus ussuriensis x Pyrus communis]